jgi:hypothetical protein
VFQYTTSGLPAGPANLAFWAIDADGRRSVTWSFLVTLTGSGTQRIDGIIVPPSIELSATTVAPGDTLTIRGTTVPRATARIEYAPGRQVAVLTGNDGRYSVVVDTDGLSVAVYDAKTRVEFPPAGDLSTWSQLVPYGIGTQPPALCTQNPDINRDGRVDLVDFSILAFWWKKSVPLGSPQDQNCDRFISLADFSILAYHWSGRR